MTTRRETLLKITEIEAEGDTKLEEKLIDVAHLFERLSVSFGTNFAVALSGEGPSVLWNPEMLSLTQDIALLKALMTEFKQMFKDLPEFEMPRKRNKLSDIYDDCDDCEGEE